MGPEQLHAHSENGKCVQVFLSADPMQQVQFICFLANMQVHPVLWDEGKNQHGSVSSRALQSKYRYTLFPHLTLVHPSCTCTLLNPHAVKRYS